MKQWIAAIFLFATLAFASATTLEEEPVEEEQSSLQEEKRQYRPYQTYYYCPHSVFVKYGNTCFIIYRQYTKPTWKSAFQRCRRYAYSYPGNIYSAAQARYHAQMNSFPNQVLRNQFVNKPLKGFYVICHRPAITKYIGK